MRWIVLVLISSLATASHAQSSLSALGAVGRLTIDGGGFCTATLISETHVLTAGHCLYDVDTGAPVDVARMEFRAGWKNGRAEALRNIKQAVAHPAFEFGANAGLDRVAHDIAVIELRRPIRDPNIRPLPVAQKMPTEPEIGIVSYMDDKAGMPISQELCHILGEQKGAYVMSCLVDFGSSGAPVLQSEFGRPAIISVVSAKAKMGDDPISLGARAQDQVRVIANVMAQNQTRQVAFKAAKTRRSQGVTAIKP